MSRIHRSEEHTGLGGVRPYLLVEWEEIGSSHRQLDDLVLFGTARAQRAQRKRYK